jgi:hypothetical protein
MRRRRIAQWCPACATLPWLGTALAVSVNPLIAVPGIKAKGGEGDSDSLATREEASRRAGSLGIEPRRAAIDSQDLHGLSKTLIDILLGGDTRLQAAISLPILQARGASVLTTAR